MVFRDTLAYIKFPIMAYSFSFIGKIYYLASVPFPYSPSLTSNYSNFLKAFSISLVNVSV